MNPADYIYNIAILVLLASLLIALRRLLRGPYSVDRVVALDTITIHTISLIVSIAFLKARGIYLDIALVYALVSFIGIIGLARYLIGGLR